MIVKKKKVSVPKNYYWVGGIVIIIIILGIFFYFEYSKENYLRSSECEIKEPDPDGYLLKICKYIKENEIDVSPADPIKYNIESIEEGQYSRFEGDEYIVTDVLVIRLDCCYMGDLAYVDKETKEVIGFSPGDI